MKNKTSNAPEKKKIWKRVSLIAAIVIIVFILTLAVFIYSELAKINKYTPEATIAPQYETFETDGQAVSSDAPVVRSE